MGAPLGARDLGKVTAPGRAHRVTILFIPLSAAQNNLDADWAEAGAEIVRRCPVCLRDSIIGHGRRRKQAHDEDHDWIPVRRGLCNVCGKTFTLLPPFSPPYCHYSLIARSQALRRWFRHLDSSQPPFSFVRRTMQAVGQWLGKGHTLHHGSLRLCWRTLFPFLRQFWPLRL